MEFLVSGYPEQGDEKKEKSKAASDNRRRGKSPSRNRQGGGKSMAQHNPAILGLVLPSMWFPTGDC